MRFPGGDPFLTINLQLKPPPSFKMAQNADLIKQAMFEELQKILNPNGEIRRNAEERLAQLKYTEGKRECPEHGGTL